MRRFSLGQPDGSRLEGELGPEELSFVARRGEGVVARPSGEWLGDDPFHVLAGLLDGDPETLWVGWFGYGARDDLPARPAEEGLADAIWMRCRDVRRVPADAVTPSAPPAHPDDSHAPDWYRDAFAAVQRALRAGDTYETNLTYRVHPEIDEDPWALYERLRHANPAPYAGYVRHGDTHLVSCSPERFAAIDADRVLTSGPIKGTTPRLTDPDEDAAAARRLASEAKFRAENLMITDLARNDVGLVSELGSVEVPELMQVHSLAAVHQLVTTVTGRLRPEVSTPEALRVLFPPASMTGAPKPRTMELIDRVEATPRGIYAGAYGWISGDGRCDLAVVIRSLVRTPAGRWLAGTGGGITVDSDVQEEWAESLWKLRRLLSGEAPRP